VSNAPAQLVLDLAHRPALGAEDFLVSAANQTAVDMIDLWPQWPHWAVVVAGPAQAGKTHLANVWRLKSGAVRLAARDLCEDDIARVSDARAVLVEDLHDGADDERVLFHLLNLVREHRMSMLLTSRAAAGELQVALPDLRSRLRSLPVVAIAPPDDQLLKAVLVKHFSDRQLLVEPHIVNHIALHMERSMEAAQKIVTEIDHHALASHRKVTRALAAEILARQR
jgi:chromosomal replication initiation ATPase DnaA